MNGPNFILGVTNIGIAVLIAGLSIPLVTRKVRMNRFYGVRIPKAFVSDANWYEINAYGGRQLMIWSVLPLLAGIACFFLNMEDADKGLTPVLLSVIPVMMTALIALVQSTRFANKL